MKMYYRQGITIRLTKDMVPEKEYRLPPSIEASTRHPWSKAHKNYSRHPSGKVILKERVQRIAREVMRIPRRGQQKAGILRVLRGMGSSIKK